MIIRERLTPSQSRFLKSDAHFAALVGGIGLGKSTAMRYYLLKRAFSQHPSDRMLLATTTDQQLRDTILDPLFAFFDELGLYYSYNRNSKLLTLGPAKIICTSLDNPNPLRGIEVSTIIVDEAAFAKEEALDILLGRLRSKYRKDLQFRAITSPNGYNRFYQLFAGENRLPGVDLIQGRTRENIFLPRQYVEALYASYTPKQAAQELEGQFVSLTTGAMYYTFDMDKHVSNKAVYDPEYPIYIGMDFNVGLHCSILVQHIAGTLVVFDEICLPEVGTREAAQAIRDKYGLRTKYPITIMPDATGSRRQTSAENSDHEILRRYGFLVNTDRSNPRVEDRVNTVNLLFQNSEMIVSPKCSTLIRDLNLMTYSTKARDPLLSHASDALGYAAYKLKPLVAAQQPTHTIIFD